MTKFYRGTPADFSNDYLKTHLFPDRALVKAASLICSLTERVSTSCELLATSFEQCLKFVVRILSMACARERSRLIGFDEGADLHVGGANSTIRNSVSGIHYSAILHSTNY